MKLPNGLYHAEAPNYEPKLVDPHYEGFRIVYVRPHAIKYSQHSLGIKDTIEPMKNMADGKMYTSKSKHLAALKAADSHVIEAGEGKAESQAKLRGDYGCKKELRDAIRQHLH